MNLRLLPLAMLTLSLAACSFKKPSAQSPEEKAAHEVIQNIEQQKFNGQLSEENVKVEFVEAEYPGTYTLVATWPKDVPGMKVSLNKEPHDIMSNTNRYQKVVIHGDKISLHFIALNSIGGEISSLLINSQAPQDLILESTMSLSKDEAYNVNRAYIFQGARIFTNGNNLTIEANKIISQVKPEDSISLLNPAKTHIQTHIPGSLATDRSQIKSGHIHIKAVKATGVLRIGLFGLNGLDGKPGSNTAHIPALDGAPGIAGTTTREFEPCADPPCIQRTPSIVCSKNPTAGQPGKKGLTGGRGEDGMNGGDTGTLSVFIEDSSEFRLEVTLKAGAPGKGGAGGQGSPGGQGGAPGDNPHNKCVAASRGTDGPTGDIGPNGADGQMGTVHKPVTNVKNISVMVQ